MGFAYEIHHLSNQNQTIAECAFILAFISRVKPTLRIAVTAICSIPRPAGDGWDGGGFVDLGKIKFV